MGPRGRQRAKKRKRSATAATVFADVLRIDANLAGVMSVQAVLAHCTGQKPVALGAFIYEIAQCIPMPAVSCLFGFLRNSCFLGVLTVPALQENLTKQLMGLFITELWGADEFA